MFFAEESDALRRTESDIFNLKGRGRTLLVGHPHRFILCLLTSFRFSIITRNFKYMDCIGLSFIQLQDQWSCVINFFYILYAAALCFSPWINLGTKLFFHLIQWSICCLLHHLYLISFLWPDYFQFRKFCSSNHHIGVYLLVICSFDLCEYLV